MSGSSDNLDEAATAAGLTPPTIAEIYGTHGAQVVLDFGGAASLGARGVFKNKDWNTRLRDAGFVQMGLDPNNVTGGWRDNDRPLPTPEPPP